QKAIPLIELLWWRATSGKHFTTPEARAALERELKQQISTIKDKDIHRYYFQDIKRRLFEFFHSSLLKQKKQGEYIQNQKDGMFKDQSFSALENSNIVRSSKHFIPLREAVILLILAYYPELWYENFDVFAELELKNAQLMSLHQSMLEILGNQQLCDKETMTVLLEKKVKKNILEHIDNLVQRVGMRITFGGTPVEDARAVLK
ncbi:MAG: DNA primase, partial [Bartonella sp.]|nr:DNA primase [Bartonella sp.]